MVYQDKRNYGKLAFSQLLAKGAQPTGLHYRNLASKFWTFDQTHPRFCIVPPSVAPSGLRVSIRRFSMDFNAFYEPLRALSALYIDSKPSPARLVAFGKLTDPALGLEPITVTRWGFPLSSSREIVKEAVQWEYDANPCRWNHSHDRNPLHPP
ncbi:hypothetical protein ANOM_011598 [Aspergillus nomiae NRRL 13137]|uniref:Uncharacterized protein n=1 Tax=Aspergillus nomiae NRRL (strain ATCC 15546 / NRRL 13137 / CBS 260.88 / M93) TaxID=1509407 RepID=A0A0L1IL26_ASPN3|nr:uncharacterized protein ANOM_011598 [Aspergillus nomiae NRRL 13137]KNG79950.1 hypothetical protein ANOM_011598 [Aspergillus nomiae NRRL 13137]